MKSREGTGQSTILGVAVCQIYEFNDGEDGKTYLWNATEGRRLTEAREAEIIPIYLADMGMTPAVILRFAPDLDVAKARNLPGVALLSPLLFVPHHGKHVCVDGWHRLYRAAILGIPCLPAYVLTEEEAAQILVAKK